jgi:hypothetical protein
LEELGTKYDELKNLQKGTKEWSKAVLELNGQIMDLVTKYPDLAGLVKNEGGVLTLDIESDAV